MKCQNCKADMKDICKTTNWIQTHVLWCPECGTLLKRSYSIDDTTQWYKPGYLFEKEKTA